MSNYDNWLVRDYEIQMDEAERFTDWMEENGFDPDDAESYAQAEEAYQAWLDDMAESWAEDAYDRHQDWLMDQYDEMCDY